MADLVCKCPDCGHARQLAAQLQVAMRVERLEAVAYRTGDDGKKPAPVFNTNTLEIHCKRCKDTMVLLTPYGEQLAGLIAAAISEGRKLRVEGLEAPAMADEELAF